MADEELKSLLLAQSIEIRRHFDVSVERMEARFVLLAEAIAQVDQKVVRAVDRIDETIERTAAETQAMVKFSHAELDRRVRLLEESHRSLEETVATLAARVERLEDSAQ